MPSLVILNQKTTFKRKFQYRMTHDDHWRKMTLVAHFLQTVFWNNRNTDKMSDEEKIPIALAGLAGISLPFILGLIALYSAK